MHAHLDKILINQVEIVERSKQLAKEISEKYAKTDKPLILVALLKGSVPFLAELMKHMSIDIEIDFMDVSSYGTNMESTRDIRILKDLDRSIKEHPIVIVEDIVDTGRTLQAVIKILDNKGAQSIEVVSLLDKPSRREVEVDVAYIGFEIPNEFVVGFGLDFAEKYRELPYIGILHKDFY
ncbi:MAG: hypoxanthine phosphoribosyltransferase [Erysipelothrix sp.]|nr:hypoxanthine phosphoribosyltransferase [Erysipelothrix sp.]